MKWCSICRHIVFCLRVILICFIFFVHRNSSNCCESSVFVRAAHCPGQVISLAHLYRTLKTRSLLTCVSTCQLHDHCVSLVFDVASSTCYLGNETATETCSNMVTASKHWKYYEEMPKIRCENGGISTSHGTSCICPDGYFGNVCDMTIADCEEYVSRDLLTKKGTYWIKPALSPFPFPVFCDYLPSSGVMRTRILRRKDPSADFNLTFQEYQDGFGEPASTTHWLGLEKTHQLTSSKKYEMRFRVRLSNSTIYYQYYQTFVVHNATNGYIFSYLHAPSYNNLGDCLVDLRGARFSAYDADNDDSSSVHCARRHGGGWWFKGDNCTSCNPLGPILSPFDGLRKGVEGESFWSSLGDSVPFSFVVFLVEMP